MLQDCSCEALSQTCTAHSKSSPRRYQPVWGCQGAEAPASHVHLWAALVFTPAGRWVTHNPCIKKGGYCYMEILQSQATRHCYWTTTGCRGNQWSQYFTCNLSSRLCACWHSCAIDNRMLECVCRAPDMEGGVISQRECYV